MTEKDFHPVASIWPLMTGIAFQELVDDIMLHGLINPIWRHDGKIIDGRNRFNACMKAAVTPRYQEWNGKGSLVEFVVSLNEKRRHLSDSQRAMVAANIANMNLGDGRPQGLPSQVSNIDAAKLMNTSSRSVRRARRIKNDAVPEIVAMVESGELTVVAAERVSQATTNEQHNAVKQGVAGVKNLSSEIKNEAKPYTGKPIAKEDNETTIEIKGVGVIRAHEAINCLFRIPKNDALRKRGFQVVSDWMKHNS